MKEQHRGFWTEPVTQLSKRLHGSINQLVEAKKKSAFGVDKLLIKTSSLAKHPAVDPRCSSNTDRYFFVF